MAEKIRLLVIDDEEVMRDSCAQALRRKDRYGVELAADGDEGLRALARFKPDVVLVDLKMPGVCGTELVRRLRAADPHPAIIIITGYASVPSAVETMQEGACDYLPKPFTPDELYAAVEKGVESSARRDAAAAQLERREKTQERFVTFVSHELRSPLNTVQQYIEAMLSGAAGEVPEEQKKIFERMSLSVHGLIDLVNEWLNVARIRSGKITAPFAPVSVCGLAHGAAEALRPLAGARAVRIELELPGNDPLVLGDRTCLERVAANLVDNAVKYSPKRGVVRIRVAGEGGQVRFEVRDTGRGIAEADLPRVFDDFYTTGRGGAHKDGDEMPGYGIGLAIVKQIVELHAGTVKVSSKVGEGTTFTITLPKAERPHEQA